MKIATIINYCTHDYRFLSRCIQEVGHFSEQTIISVADHFFDGTPEDRALLERSYSEHPECTFVEYKYDPQKPYGVYPVGPDDEEWIHYWHSTGRYFGFLQLADDIDYVAFVDVDEIFDGKRFAKWLQSFDTTLSAVRLSSYFYFREACFRAQTFSLNVLLVKKNSLSAEMLLDVHERKGTFAAIAGAKMEHVRDLDDSPFVHHFSWVKPKAELMLKVIRWGHHHEQDWQALLEEEFAAPFRGVDKLYGLRYDFVEPYWDPLVRR